MGQIVWRQWMNSAGYLVWVFEQILSCSYLSYYIISVYSISILRWVVEVTPFFAGLKMKTFTCAHSNTRTRNLFIIILYCTYYIYNIHSIYSKSAILYSFHFIRGYWDNETVAEFKMYYLSYVRVSILVECVNIMYITSKRCGDAMWKLEIFICFLCFK